MRRKVVVLIILLVLSVLATTLVAANGASDLATVREATARYHRLDAAQTAGWALLDGLDHCFSNPGVGAMGYHYIDAAALDLSLDASHPEALVYAPDPSGKLRLAAVEYIVPAADWDAAHPGTLPSVLGHDLHLNTNLGVYVLHAWVWMHNPAGMFADWNSLVSCS